MPPGSTQAAHESSIYNMATFSYLPPSGRYAFSLPTEPVSRAEAAILAEAYARSAAAISARIAGGFQTGSQQEAGFEPTTSHDLSARVGSAGRSDLLREDFTEASGHASAPALTRRPSPVGVSSRRSVPPNHTPSSMTGKSKEEKTAQSRYGVVMEFDIDPKVSIVFFRLVLGTVLTFPLQMPNPHEEPARFARWFRDFFYDMLDMGEGLISGNTFTLLMGLEPNELKDEEPDRFANFELRPNTKLFILKRAANVESMSMTLAGTEVETPCSSCERGRGPYTRCIVVPGMGKGSCSNCRYNGQGTRCSFWSKGQHTPPSSALFWYIDY